MQAILGPSGAGKSTLMDILALRGGAGRLCRDAGCVLVDGHPRAAPDFLARSAYVPQVRGWLASGWGKGGLDGRLAAGRRLGTTLCCAVLL
jgi:ABC-type Mn2+/Zn2+ transport system ATPase subunit